MVLCGSSPVTRLYLAKNEAPEEEAEFIGLDPVIHTTKKRPRSRDGLSTSKTTPYPLVCIYIASICENKASEGKGPRAKE